MQALALANSNLYTYALSIPASLIRGFRRRPTIEPQFVIGNYQFLTHRDLRITIEAHYDLEEFRTLCFDLGIDFDSLPGEGKAGKARELILYLERHDRLPELLSDLKPYLDRIEAEGYFQRGMTLYNRRKDNLALTDFRKAVQLNPERAEYYYWLGFIYHRLRNYGQAVAAKLKALQLDPANPEYHYSLGRSYHKNRRYSQAIDAYDKAIELDPTMASYYFEKGLAYLGVGLVEEAREAFQQAADLGFRDAQKELNKLKSS